MICAIYRVEDWFAWRHGDSPAGREALYAALSVYRGQDAIYERLMAQRGSLFVHFLSLPPEAVDTGFTGRLHPLRIVEGSEPWESALARDQPLVASPGLRERMRRALAAAGQPEEAIERFEKAYARRVHAQAVDGR